MSDITAAVVTAEFTECSADKQRSLIYGSTQRVESVLAALMAILATGAGGGPGGGRPVDPQDVVSDAFMIALATTTASFVAFMHAAERAFNEIAPAVDEAIAVQQSVRASRTSTPTTPVRHR